MQKEKAPLGLYIHIPFCRQKCAYCDFYSLPRSEEKMDAYTAALLRHIEEVAPRTAAHRVDTVYFGGGTPSYLGPDRLTKLLRTLRKRCPVARDAEITLEANPDSACDVKALRALRRAGFNRISLGVQSADDGLLRAIGRIHTFAQVQEAVAAVRKAGFKNLSMDLIYGLPGQTMQQWEDDEGLAFGSHGQHRNDAAGRSRRHQSGPGKRKEQQPGGTARNTLSMVERGVLHRHPAAKLILEPQDHLRGQADLRHQHQRTPALLQTAGNEL